MEPQYLVDEGYGGALVFLILGVLIFIKVIRVMISGTLSEEAQRKNIRRKKSRQ